nr:uncharacterized protein LOC104084765 [Nicotiana tomentosiformis]
MATLVQHRSVIEELGKEVKKMQKSQASKKSVDKLWRLVTKFVAAGDIPLDMLIDLHHPGPVPTDPTTTVASTTFAKLKEALSSVPVLSLPESSKDFVVETDASSTDIGAVIFQDSHLIAFFSKKISSRMQAASTYNREIFAITQGVQKWR